MYSKKNFKIILSRNSTDIKKYFYPPGQALALHREATPAISVGIAGLRVYQNTFK